MLSFERRFPEQNAALCDLSPNLLLAVHYGSPSGGGGWHNLYNLARTTETRQTCAVTYTSLLKRGFISQRDAGSAEDPWHDSRSERNSPTISPGLNGFVSFTKRPQRAPVRPKPIRQSSDRPGKHSGITHSSIFARDSAAAVEPTETQMLGSQPHKPAVAF